MEMLSGLKSMTLAEGVENSLLQYIRGSGLQPGAPLPKEEELAERLNVSRHVVREGLSRLKTMGLIESRKRRGMEVARPNVFAGFSKLAEINWFSPEENRELMEIRIVMEMGMVDFIYERKTPEKLSVLRQLAGGHSSFHSLESELAFHETLFAIGGNAMASQFRNVLASALKSVYRKPSFSDQETPTHLEICDKLEHGPLEEFRKIMKSHFIVYMNKDW